MRGTETVSDAAWDKLTAPAAEIDVIAPIENFCISNWGTISAAFKQKGGWEGWLQVQLAFMLTEKFIDRNVFRETPLYDGSYEKDDITVEKTSDASTRTHVLEIKCESIYKDGLSDNNFCHEFDTQTQRIFTRSVRPAFRPAILYSLGFTCTEVVERQMRAYDFSPKPKRTLLNSGSDGFALYSWLIKREQNLES